MKKFLRCKGCGKLLSPEGKWVQEASEAWEFEDFAQVTEAVKAFHLPAVDLYFSFEDDFHSGRWDFEIEFPVVAEES